MTRRRSTSTAATALTLLASLALVACGGGGPKSSDAQVERWLAAVQGYSNRPGEADLCYLLTRAQLTNGISHPSPAWSVEGFNDQTTDARRFVGCSVRSGTDGKPGLPGDGELGLVSSASLGSDPAGSDAHGATRTVSLPGTHWKLFYLAWPGTKRGSSAELDRVVADVVGNLAEPPPSSPSPAVYAGPDTALR